MSEPTNNHILPCGICGQLCSHLGARGRTVVCNECEKRVTDAAGRPIDIEFGFTFSGCVRVATGPTAVYSDAPQGRKETAEEVTRSLTGYIDGKPVEMFEGAAGWLGWVLPKTSP